MCSGTALLKKESKSSAVCETQERLLRDLGTERSSNRSTSRSIQRLEKSSVAIKQNFFYWDLSPLHWTYCLLFHVLTLRECLLTRVKWTKAEIDPGAEAGSCGAPKRLWMHDRRWGRKKEQSEAANGTGVIMDSHIRSVKVWWEMGYGSSLAWEVDDLVWSEAVSAPVTLCLMAGAWGLCWGFWRLPQVTAQSGNTWF